MANDNLVRFAERLAVDAWTVPTESPIERAAQFVHIAVADFIIAIQLAQTSVEAERIHKMIAGVCMALGAAEDAAALRADVLRGKGL